MAPRFSRPPRIQRAPHSDHREEQLPAKAAHVPAHPLVSLQRMIGNSAVQRLLADQTAPGAAGALQGRIQRFGYGFEDDPLASGGYGGYSEPQSSSSSGETPGGGYGYGFEDDPLAAGGFGGESEYGGSSESGGSSRDEGYGYEFGDDPLAAGGFGANEYF